MYENSLSSVESVHFQDVRVYVEGWTSVTAEVPGPSRRLQESSYTGRVTKVITRKLREK